MKNLIRIEIIVLVIVGALAAVKFLVPREKLFFWKNEQVLVASSEPESEVETAAGITVSAEADTPAETPVEAITGEVVAEGEIMQAEPQNAEASAPAQEAQTTPAPIIDMTNRTSIEITKEVSTKLAELTTEQKVSQLFLTSPEALAGTGLVEKAGDRTKKGIQKHPVGGVIYSPANGRTDKQISKIIVDTQKLFEENAPLPMIVGGTVAAGKTDIALSTTTSADSVIPVIVKKSLDAAAEGSEAVKILDNFDSKANGYSVYKCLNLNVITGTKPENVAKALLQNGDLVYVNTNLDKYYKAVLKAVENKEIKAEELDAIVGRVLAVKLAMPKKATTLVE